MAEALMQNKTRDYWAEVKRVRCKSNVLPNLIDGVQGKENIANIFADKYETLYNSSCIYSKDAMDNFINDANTKITESCCNGTCENNHVIYPNDIRNAVKLLKYGKQDGNVGHYTDHLKHGTSKLFTCLSLLFTSMLTHGCTPKGFLLSTVVPIPKNKRKSLNDAENYRGIALSSVLGKVFDLILLHNN